MSEDRDVARLRARYLQVRALTEALAAPLGPEDQCVQAMPDASPTKWHRAHTSWFFETFVLAGPGFRPYQPGWDYLFNSYYQTVGAMHPRARRGLLSRPTTAEIGDYRRWVDDQILALLDGGWASQRQLELVELGLHHEQQHQELLLTDAKFMLAQNPLSPRYRATAAPVEQAAEAPALTWIEAGGGLVEIGRASESGFGFDNEGPRHTQFLSPYALASRPATNAEYRAFVEDGGYRRPELWLAEGWDTVRREGWCAPLYWRDGGEFPGGESRPGREFCTPGEPGWEFTLDGQVPLELAAPVCHLSYFEADAFARWSDARLPTEAEWEHLAAAEPTPPIGAANLLPVEPGALTSAPLRPRPSPELDRCVQLFGDVWEWTASAYLPYPGYRPPAGAVGEYNGKFMVNQQVLRGGSCLTPADHIRASYRNFFPTATRWQAAGVRLARDR